MPRRKSRPKRELLSLLHRLNDCVGVSARRVYTHQFTPADLLQRSQSEIHSFLPELCDFIQSLVPIIVTSTTNTIVCPPAAIVRATFRHPDAQWLSRSARESGISSLFCQQLVRLARQEDRSKPHNNSEDGDNTIYWSAATIMVHVLLDALLSPCAQRLGKPPDACRWRLWPQLKPRFHAMTCFPVWSTLVPFAAIIGTRMPIIFLNVLETYHYPNKKKADRRVNCAFAHVTGTWRLINELEQRDKTKQNHAVTKIMASLLQFVTDKLLRDCIKNNRDIANEETIVDVFLEDQLLEKFFTGMQEFSFKSGRAHDVFKPMLCQAIEKVLTGIKGRGRTGVVRQRVIVFTTAVCVLVKDLGGDIVSMVIKLIEDGDVFFGGEGRCCLLTFLVGFCAHVDLVPLTSVLEVLELLIKLYKAVGCNAAADFEQQRQQQCELVFYVVYMALSRSESIDSLRREVGADAAVAMRLLTQFQIHLWNEIAYEDFQVAAPVHWMARVWKHWVFLSDSEVQFFVAEAQENDTDTEQEFKKRVAMWQSWEAQIAFKLSTFSLFTQMKTLVTPHLIATLVPDWSDDENEFAVQARKRRRMDKKCSTSVDPKQIERSLDVLLLPDVMGRVCSFMSAKRLCRMNLVCREFAKISHQASPWRHLYLQIGSANGKKHSLLPASPVECHHGTSYKHEWRQMYQERWKVLRQLRRMQRRTLEAKQWSEREESITRSETFRSNTRTAKFMPLMCAYCGCNQILKSASEQEVHEAQHKRCTCTEVSCQASFSSVRKFKHHVKEHAIESAA